MKVKDWICLIGIIAVSSAFSLFMTECKNACIIVEGDNAWIGFWGAIFGGVIAVFGVSKTLEQNHKEAELERILAMRPCLKEQCRMLTVEEAFQLAQKDVKQVLNIATKGKSASNDIGLYTEKEKEEAKDDLFLLYIVDNIGCGHAINVLFKINDFDYADPYIIKIGEDWKFLFRIQKSFADDNNENIVQLQFIYKDILSKKAYEQHQSICVSGGENVVWKNYKSHLTEPQECGVKI